MTDSELIALTKLLDDEDEDLQREIRRQLLTKGPAFVPRLEWLWEQQVANPFVQEKIVDMIQMVQSENTRILLKKWRMAGGKDLLEGWFLLSQSRYPSLELATFRYFVTRLVNIIWLAMDDTPKHSERILAVNRVLFHQEGFRADRITHTHPDRFFLKTFWENKIGNTFSLGMLYLIICQKLELPVTAILLPNYMTLHYEDHKYDFFIDTYNDGGIFYKKDLDEFIEECNFPPNPDYYLRASNRMVLVGLIDALIHIHEKKKEMDKVLTLEVFREALR